MPSILRWIHSVMAASHRTNTAKPPVLPSVSALEDRRLFSGAPMMAELLEMTSQASPIEMARGLSVATVPNIKGTYRGTASLRNGPTLSITAVVKKQNGSKISGNVTIQGYGRNGFKATGKIKADRTFTFNFSSESAGVSGSLAGRLAKRLKSATGTFKVVYDGEYRGTFSIQKV